MPTSLPVLTLSEAATNFEEGDALFKIHSTWWGKLISIVGLSNYSHVGMLVLRNGVWCLLDMDERKGGSSRTLHSVLKQEPNLWHHFKANPNNRWPEFDRNLAVKRMWEFDNTNYGTKALWKASFIFLPGVRLLQKVDKFVIDDEKTVRNGDPTQEPIPAFCSMAMGMAYDAGGVDPVNLLRHSMTTPGELSRSLFLQRICALVPDSFNAGT